MSNPPEPTEPPDGDAGADADGAREPAANPDTPAEASPDKPASAEASSGTPASTEERKSRFKLIAGLSVTGLIVVGIGVFLFTAFVSPGFLVSGPDDVADDFVSAMDRWDTKFAVDQLCDATDEDLLTAAEVRKLQDREVSIIVSGKPVLTGGEAFVPATIGIDDRTKTGHVVLQEREDGWCVSSLRPNIDSIAPPPRTGARRTDLAQQAARSFVRDINQGKRANAVKTLCPDVRKSFTAPIDDAIANGANLKLARKPEGTTFVQVALTGSYKGRPTSGSVFLRTRDNGDTWCVSSFIAV